MNTKNNFGNLLLRRDRLDQGTPAPVHLRPLDESLQRAGQLLAHRHPQIQPPTCRLHHERHPMVRRAAALARRTRVPEAQAPPPL